MPLLGRHKSLPGSSANQSSSKNGSTAASTAAKQQPLVCESPLFGVRRQLPVASQQPSGDASSQDQRQQKGAALSSPSAMPYSMSLSSRLSSSSSSGKPQLQQQKSRDGQLGSTLCSIPKQISRQQIHYAFSIMDTNSDGLIDLRDLSQMLANLGVPIDEAILSHVMAPVSKRGDHLISENEFLDWIGIFIQVQSEETNLGRGAATLAASSGGQSTRTMTGGPSMQARSPVARSVSASCSLAKSVPASLAAQSPEAQYVINQQMRQRRGSGSGLALVRSLSSSPSGAADAASNPPSADPLEEVANSKRERIFQDQQEARRDLKAAFCVFDLDGDGFITIDEVQQGLKLLGESWSQAELNHLFNQCSSNRPKPGGITNNASKHRIDLSKQRISIDDFVQLLL